MSVPGWVADLRAYPADAAHAMSELGVEAQAAGNDSQTMYALCSLPVTHTVKLPYHFVCVTSPI